MPTTHQAPNALGIDVYHGSGHVDWSQVLHVGGRAFAFAKATEGAHTNDDLFVENYTAMGQVGITRGAYHFFRSNVDAQAQAEHFLDKYKPLHKKTDMLPAVDVETVDETGTTKRIEGVQKWLELVEAELGAKPLIYTFPSFWHTSMNDTKVFSDAGYLLWIARFTTAPTPGVLPGGWDKYTIWQHAAGDPGSPQVHVPGVQAAVDSNRFNGTHADLIELFHLNG